MKIRLLLTFVALLFCGMGFAQQPKTISGTIVGADGMPLPGAEVKVIGKNIFDITDFDGKFTLEGVVEGDTFRVTFLGFKPQELPVVGANDYQITLEEDAAALDEVVVVGYGTQRKADLTGSIVTIESEEIEKTPTSNVMQSLQGKVAGVQITSVGAPGNSPNVRVRGLGTFTSGTNVL